MQRIFDKVFIRAEGFNNRRISRFNAAVLALEKTYKRILKPGKIALIDSLLATWLILKIQLNTVESYFILVGIWVVSFTGGIFFSHIMGVEVEQLAPSLIAVLITTIVPIFIAFITTPLQILCKFGLPSMTVLHAILSALGSSVAIVFMFNSLLEIQSLSFLVIFSVMLPSYLLVDIYMTLRIKDFICIVYFLRRQSQNDFNDVLPPNKRGQILSLNAQDHYVEFSTENGSHLHRISMKSAIELMPKNTGIQVHRSHWVAFNSMKELSKKSERYVLTINNGMQVPVSKAKYPTVKAYFDQRASHGLKAPNTSS